MKFHFLFLSVVLATLENNLHKYDKKYDSLKAKYDEAISKYMKEKETGDPTVLLIWWGPQYPLLKKIETQCGECWITHEKNLEKEAAGFGLVLFLSKDT